jgi:hypothetical protein
VRLSDALIEEMQREFPGFCLVHKRQDRASRVIDLLLRVVTLGGQRGYLTVYHTVIGDTLYLPDSWSATSDVDRAITLRHERVHLRQRRRWGLPLMAFLYLVPFFPLGLAYGRARIEWEAYRETLRATAELSGIAEARSPALRAHILRRFTGPDYGWMWPFEARVSAWYDEALAAVEAEFAPGARIALGSGGASEHGEQSA